MENSSYSAASTGEVFRPDEKPAASAPYGIRVKNTKNTKQKAVLFGFDENFNKKNFGSDPGITIEIPFGNKTYGKLLAQSATKPFKTGHWKLLWTCNSKSPTMTYVYADSDGHETIEPLLFFADSYQFQNHIIDESKDVLIDGSAAVNFVLGPHEEIDIYIWPEEKISFWRMLKGLQLTPILKFLTPKKWKPEPVFSTKFDGSEKSGLDDGNKIAACGPSVPQKKGGLAELLSRLSRISKK